MISSKSTTVYPEVNVFTYMNGNIQIQTWVRQKGESGDWYLTEISMTQTQNYDKMMKDFAILVHRQFLSVPDSNSKLDQNQEDESQRIHSAYLSSSDRDNPMQSVGIDVINRNPGFSYMKEVE